MRIRVITINLWRCLVWSVRISNLEVQQRGAAEDPGQVSFSPQSKARGSFRFCEQVLMLLKLITVYKWDLYCVQDLEVNFVAFLCCMKRY